jgi:DNA-binding beta-propeller fold protein YncE
MKNVYTACFTLTWMALVATLTSAQQTAPKSVQKSAPAEHERPLVMTGSVPLEGLKGGFDHFASAGGRVFVAARSVGVLVFTANGGTFQTIPVPAPQGIVFSPEANKLFVGSAKGKLYIFDGSSYKPITTIDFKGGADNLRYDAATKRVYVGCGDDEKTGAIAAVDAMTNKRLDEEYKVGDEPESFQLEKAGPNIYVNVRGLKQIAVINRTTKAITRWTLNGLALNFPMALDEADHRLFIGTREPPRLAVFDTKTGHMVTALPTVVDADDLYYDADRKRIYMPGAEGFINVFQMIDPDHYQLYAKVATGPGARTAGFFGTAGKDQTRFYSAVPAYGNQGAEIKVYTVLN